MTKTVKVLQFEDGMTDYPFGTVELNGRRMDFILKGRSLVVSDKNVTQEERHTLVMAIADHVSGWMKP